MLSSLARTLVSKSARHPSKIGVQCLTAVRPQRRFNSTATTPGLGLGYNFKGKRAIVTGAGKGIGFGLSVALAHAGAEVIAVTRAQADLDALVEECPGSIVPVRVDMENHEELVAKLEAIGDIDMVVNNAGIANLESFLEVSPDAFDQVMGVNVRSVITVSQIAARNMIERGVPGAIVNVSSQASQVGLPDHTSYCISKGGVDQLTRCMALELGPKKIRTNAVNPTVVLTALGRAAWSDPEKAGPMLSRIPIGRFAEIKDAVDPILFLLSDQSEMINGATLPIDGGFWAV